MNSLQILQDLILQKKKKLVEIDYLNTQIIGLKIFLELEKEKEQVRIQNDRDSERSGLYDE